MKQALIIAAIVASILLFAAYVTYQYKTFGTYLHTSDKDCTTTLPAAYKIVYSEVNKDYAVTVDKPNIGKGYVWANGSRFDWHFDPYTTFSDSCKAKSFVLNYLRNEDLENNKSQKVE